MHLRRLRLFANDAALAAPPAPAAAAPAAPAPATPPAAAPVTPPAAPSLLDLAPKPPADPAAPPAPASDGKLILKERPAWLAEPFHDATTGEVKLEALAKAQADLRAQISRGDHKPPAKPEDYKLDFSTDPDIKRAADALIVPGEDGSPDPVMSAVQKAAHAAGVSQAGLAAIVNTFLKEQAAILPAPIDEQAELAKLGAQGPALLKNLWSFADQEVKYGRWDQADMDKFRSYMQDASDAKFLQKVLQASGRIPEVQAAMLQQAADAPDNAALDAEQARLDEDFRAGKLTDAQATAKLAEINAKRAKLMGQDATGVWPPRR